MTRDQKIKMLQLGLQYLLPKLKHTSGDRDIYGLFFVYVRGRTYKN